MHTCFARTDNIAPAKATSMHAGIDLSVLVYMCIPELGCSILIYT